MPHFPNNTYSLKELLQDVADRYRFADKIIQVNIESQWKEIAGEFISNNTQNVSIEGQRMLLVVPDPVLRNELLYRKEEIIERVNTFYKKTIIDEIILINRSRKK